MKVKIGRGKVKIVKHRLKKKKRKENEARSKKMDVEGSAWEFFFIDFALLPVGKFKFNRIGACEGMKYL